MGLIERIKLEKNRAKEELDFLKEDNQKDFNLLVDLNEQYKEAVINSDEEKIESIEIQITEVNIRKTRRKAKINALSDDDNPVIQSMIYDEIKNWKEEMEEIEKQTSSKLDSIKPTREKLLKDLEELKEMYKKSLRYRYAINHWNSSLNEQNREKLGFGASGINVTSPLLKDMRELEIKSHHIFGRIGE